ncbi:phosphate/phosphite/phosphonate ABC transporter substrate-binding protein [Haloarchaeobius sp. HME9146]|uniref:phosphate/phosphite/phosphonate ABC transporter substrate-binding protein n=1 Tax=Haloarchaeobius sp. HME9146 TaxID=2978732 RepID=UPI0021BF4021|nr:phosphate/phosphite/phosphonate ABC transporter substrate-binding protein [Haloarchaeobius sp. HME9146]MCT9094527.1 phosphate/phosphite/phosphonate ABC transporter substrate-binding protein [Haloarchaeobius sp. HME9146]
MESRRDFLKAAGVAGAAALTGTAGCLGSFGEQAYGDGTVQFMMSPSEPQNYMMKQYGPMRDYIDSEIGDSADVELQYAADYSAVLQGLGSGSADIAETGPFAAALGVKADKAEIALQRHAYGSWTYTSVIVTRKDSDIESLSDLKGKRVAFADMTSASGSLYPLYMLQDAGLEIGEAPVSDNGADFTGTWSGHAEAFKALQDGQVEAAGVGKFITQGDDGYVEGIEPIIDYKKEYGKGIPRAPMVVSPELSDSEKESLVSALKDAPEDAYLGKDGEGDTDDDLWFDGVRPAKLEDYQPVIDVANKLNLSTDLLDSA